MTVREFLDSKGIEYNARSKFESAYEFNGRYTFYGWRSLSYELDSEVIKHRGNFLYFDNGLAGVCRIRYTEPVNIWG